MELNWSWMSSAADWATLIAAAIAIGGAASVWLSRPRVAIVPNVWDPHSASIEVRHRKGTAPIRSLHYALVGTNQDDEPWYGDGMGLWAAEVPEGAWRLLTLYDPKQMTYVGGVPDYETRREVEADYGVVIGVSWQRPLLPWLRDYCTLVWPHSVRKAGGAIKILRGRKARRAFECASKPPA